MVHASRTCARRGRPSRPGRRFVGDSRPDLFRRIRRRAARPCRRYGPCCVGIQHGPGLSHRQWRRRERRLAQRRRTYCRRRHALRRLGLCRRPQRDVWKRAPGVLVAVTWRLNRLTGRLLASIACVILITFAGSSLSLNPTTQGFAYLLFVLIVASAWGFVEAAVCSILATLLFNFYFLPPIGTLTIADPQNWVALFSFLAVALVASRLSDTARKRGLEALESQDDIERLYTFSRAILLIDNSAPVPKQLAEKLAAVFALSAAVLYDRRSGEFFRAGPSDLAGPQREIEDQLRDSALNGTFFADPHQPRVITAVRLGAEPIA